MREKLQKIPRAAALVAGAGCVIGGLSASATAMPALAAPARHASPASPSLKVAGQPVGIASDPTTKTFWVAENDIGQPDDIVDRIAENGHKDTTIKVLSGVVGIAADSGLGMVWTIGNSSNGTTHTATVIKESDNSAAGITVAASSALTGLAIDSSTGKVFLLDEGGDVFEFIDGNLAPPVNLITGSAGTAATGIAVDPATGTLWIVNAAGNSVLKYSESGGAPIGSPISVGNNPGTIAIDSTAKTVWVGNSDSSVSEFSETSLGTVHTIKLPANPESITVDPKTGVAWAGVGFGSVFGITEKTSPPSSIGGVTPAPDPIVGIATDPTNGQVWATDNVPSQGTFNNVFPLLPTAPKFTSPSTIWFATNNASQQIFDLTTTAFPPATFTLSGAPSFLSVGKRTGVLTAKLTTKSKFGAFKATVSASNGVGAAGHQTLTVNVGSDPVLRTTSTTFAIGVKNSQQLKATGTPAPSFTGLNLPKGLTLSKTGVLSGTVPKGTKSPVQFGVELTNKLTSVSNSPVVGIFTLKLAPGKAPKLTSAAKATFKHGKHGSFTVKSTGFPSPVLKITGKLPKGLTFKAGAAGTGIIAGTPAATTKGHTFTIQITASNGVGKSAVQKLSIKIT